MVGTDEYKRVIVVDGSLDDSQHCLLNNTLQCSSFHYVLAHLQSGDYVNVTSNSVSLLTVVKLQNINNTTIRGQGNTIVMCNNTGGVSCSNCSDVVIEGITWDQCGDLRKKDIYGGINFHTITNLTVENCTFQHSKVRGLSLVALSGFVYIINSYFVNNVNYDTIFCYSHTHKGCYTTNDILTGGLLVKSNNTNASRNNIDIHIVNCTFNGNGYFGNVNNINATVLSRKTHKVFFSPGLTIGIDKPNLVQINVAINNSIFSFNRAAIGHSCIALYVKSKSPNIVLTGLQFRNNSVIKFYGKVSALRVFQRNCNESNHYKQSILNMTSCSFYGNHGGQNMLNYIVEGGPSRVTIDHCTFSNNNYSSALVNLNMQTKLLFISNLNFTTNTNKGGVIYILIYSANFTLVLLDINLVKNFDSSAGGVVLRLISNDYSTIHASRLNFTSNVFIGNGGGINILGVFQVSCNIYIADSCFKNNFGLSHGSVIYSTLNCVTDKTYLISIQNCIITHNKGRSIVYVGMEHYILPAFLLLNAEFNSNNGTALQLFNVILVGNGVTRFQNNKAEVGAALYLRRSYILLNFTSFQFDIRDNLANEYGGAIYIDILFANAYKKQCHWLLYYYDEFCRNVDHQINGCTIPINTKLLCKRAFKIRHNEATSHIYITNNTALLAGSAVFYSNVQNVYNLHTSTSSLGSGSIFNIPDTFIITPNVSEPLVMATQPQRLQLADPAKCNNDYTACNISGITLGNDIDIPASIIGYNNKPSEATRFFIECIENCIEFEVIGGPIVLIIDRLSGINVIGRKISHHAGDVFMTLKLYRGIINVKLRIKIFPCQLGYTHNERAKQCDCYSVHNIISCTANTTTIKKDYWFGVIGEQATVSLCPNKYCNFSRNEMISGKYTLHPFYDDQCDLHRTGQACGICENGYTLAFDFHDCVNINSCSPGITVVVVMCVIIYWILVIVIILWLMYFQIDVGYLYGIIYYYSVVDILLGQILNYSSSFDIIEIIISSVVKLSPRFLGKLCFLQGGMSGIDQYALHYIHPIGILLILLILSVIARHSQRFALFISRGAIRSICFILILAYTSIADTSLQLLRHLKFTDINELYSYLSPDIKYFTGRHIIYVIIAILFEVVIIVGLPVILLFEPYVNRWINFARIKPILDQFQGCYKDKCRWFAGIYLLSRQMILIIMVINFVHYYIALYLLTSLCVIIALLHHHIQPYKSSALNKFDGFILHLLLLVVSLQMVAVGDSTGFTGDAIIGISYVLIFLPIVVCIAALICYRVHTSHVDLYRYSLF